MAGRPKTNAFRVLAAIVCLLVHLGSNTAFSTLAAATVAWLDGEHSVQLSAQDSGNRLVLSHTAAADSAAASVHSHCPTCRALLLLAEKPVHGQADHVFNFGSGGVASIKPAFSAPRSPQSLASLQVSPIALVLRPPARVLLPPELLALPPPTPSALAATATTVLLV